MPLDMRRFFQFPARPSELDKADSAQQGPEVDSARITHQDSDLQEGGVWRFPQADAWPDSIFSNVPEVGEGYEQIADSIADKQRRDQVYGRVYLPPQAWNDFRIVSNSPAGTTGQNGWLFKPSSGVLHSIIPSGAGTTWVVSFFDGLQTSQPMFRYLTAMGLSPIILDIKFMEGLFVTATGTAGELVVTWL